jgi:hypothetical protein
MTRPRVASSSDATHDAAGDARHSLTDHDRAVLSAEVKRLVTALSPVGVLRRDALARASGATRWNGASFDLALQAAVDAGKINELPLGFYAIARGGETGASGQTDDR